MVTDSCKHFSQCDSVCGRAAVDAAMSGKQAGRRFEIELVVERNLSVSAGSGPCGSSKAGGHTRFLVTQRYASFGENPAEVLDTDLSHDALPDEGQTQCAQ